MTMAQLFATGLTLLFGLTSPAFLQQDDAEQHRNYRDPRIYGAKGDGEADDSAALQAAIDDGNISLSPGTYLVNRTVLVPDHRSIRCDAGVTLLTTRHDRENTAIFRWNGTSYGSVIGCSFQGTNTLGILDEDRQFNMGVQFWGPGHHNTAKRNVFWNFWGNAGLSIYGNDVTGGSDFNVVEHCQFDTNAIYGVVIVSGANNRISYNNAVDSSIGLEADDKGQVNTDNLLDHNRVTCKRKCGGEFPGNTFFSIGSAPKNFSYSGNQAINNDIGRGVNWWSNNTGQLDLNNRVVP
jgi:hypothetical protein